MCFNSTGILLNFVGLINICGRKVPWNACATSTHFFLKSSEGTLTEMFLLSLL